MELQMVDLRGQYESIKNEIDAAIHAVIDQSSFIKGSFVSRFETELAAYLDVQHVVSVGNGTDALQIALMALDIGVDDEVIAPSFTFVATTEAAALLGAIPVFVDIEPGTFNIDVSAIEERITEKTRAIVPVHLFGQPCDMDAIMALAEKYDLAVLEDNAQGIGSVYRSRRSGTIGDMGTLSFFPSKNLGCFGDGGAIVTNDAELADKARLIANHGSRKKYHNERVGINSRLDGLQAAILSVKLNHLDRFNEARITAANWYDAEFSSSRLVKEPMRAKNRKHVFHQYTVRIPSELEGARDALSAYLKEKRIPHAVYYPVPVHLLPVNTHGNERYNPGDLGQTTTACQEVLSLPMHTELGSEEIAYIAEHVTDFLEKYVPKPV